MKNVLIAAAVILFAVSSASAAGHHTPHTSVVLVDPNCSNNVGDYLGADGTCQKKSSHVPHATREQREAFIAKHRAAAPTSAGRDKPSAKDRNIYKDFVAEAEEQAAKRAAIHGRPVRPEITGGPDELAHGHIPAMFSSQGKI